MAPSHALVRAGLRTEPRTSWRLAARDALARVASSPALWLLGALGFLLRGGIVLLTVPVLVLPSPVAVRLLIGDNLGSAGFAPGFYLFIGGLAVLVTGLALAALWLAAYAEVASFERFADRPLRGAERRRLASAVFAINLVALVALVAAALPLVAGAVNVTYAELIRPSALDVGLYERVLGQLGGPLFLLLGVLVLIEAATAVATRRLLHGQTGGARPISPLTALLVGLGRPLLRPLPTLGSALLGWLATAAAVVPGLWAVGLAWQATQAVLLDPRAANSAGLGGAALAIAALCAAWLALVLLCGGASALRAGLWSAEELR